MKRIIVMVIAVFTIGRIVYCQEQSTAFKQEGLASWYGVDFDGKPTASGEIFDSTKMTAAHPTLPFGTLLKVTNKENNMSVTVRVNDRGPFIQDRIIDLSQAAAAQLNFTAAGAVSVVLEIVNEQNPVKTATILPAMPPTGTGKKYRIQVGSFRVARNAVNAFDRLKNVSLSPAYEKNEDFYRVVLAGLSAEEVPAIAEKLAQAGFTEVLIREEP